MDINASVSVTPISRRSISVLNTDLCIFCQDDTGKSTHLVMTKLISDNILSLAQHDSVMRVRLAGICDLIAADARYHLMCYVQFKRQI